MLRICLRTVRRQLLLVFLVLLGGCAHYLPKPLVPTDTAAQLRERSLSDEDLRAFLQVNEPDLVKEWPRKSWELEGLVLVAFYYHPSLDVARADWDLARAGIKTAGGRLNPSVSVDVGYDTGVANSFSPWMPAISFDVPIETAGKRQRRIERAEHLAETARLGVANTAWQVRSGVRNALLEFVAAQKQAVLLEEQTNLQYQIVDRLNLQLQSGAIGVPEVTTARTALTKTAVDLTEALRQSATTQAHLANAIGVPVSALEGVSVNFELSQKSMADRLTSVEIRDTALHSRTDILAGLTEYASAQSELQLEIARQYPDVHLSPGYLWNQQNEGDHGWQLGLTVELPVLNRNQGPIAEAEARRKATAARFIALQAKAIGEIDGAVALYNATRNNLTALESLVTSKRAQLEITTAQTKAGAEDRLQLVAAELELAAAELAEFDGRVQLQQAAGALEDAVQRPFEMPKSIYEATARNPRRLQ